VRLGLVIAAVCAALSAMNATAAPAPDDAVTSYPPTFFEGVRPNTALDMVNALPGFSLDTGGGVRGFGAAGNVLIDGERPATKNDSLDEFLKRIPASSVARIDLIRGGAPGIDMQGRAVVANVVRKTDDGLKLTTAWQETALYNGKFDYGLRLEGTKRSGDTAFEGGMLLANGADDGTGDGPRTITDPAGAVLQSGLDHTFGEQGTDKFTGAVETPVHPVDAEAHFTQGLPKLRSHWGVDYYSAWRQTFYYYDEVDVQRLGTWVDAFFEYQPRPDLALKIEADNLATHGLEYIREFYDPYRDVAGGQLSSIDNRSPRFGPELSFRLRKTFG